MDRDDDHDPEEERTEPARNGAALAVTWGVLFVALALGWRVALLVWTRFSIESDEAVLGLMAKHIASGRELPVWYYGQPYMGALEAWVAAPFVAFLGANATALKLSTLPWVLMLVVSAWLLARRVLGDVAGVFTALYWALPPLVLSVWTIKVRGGYVSMLALGHVVLWLAHVLGSRERGGDEPDDVPRDESRVGFLALGVVTGLACWLNLLVLPFVLAALVHLVLRRRLSRAAIGAGLLGTLVGFAPFWIDNLASGGATFAHLLSSKGRPHTAAGNLENTFAVVVPFLSGARLPWEGRGGPATLAHPALVFSVVSTLVLLATRSRDFLRAVGGSPRAKGVELYVVTALGYLACAAFTRFGADPRPRYAIVLYTLLAPAAGATFALLWQRRGRLRAVAPVLAAALAAFFVVDTLRQGPEHLVAPRQFLEEGGVPPLRHDALYAQLQASGVEAVAADPWLAMLVAFDTGERVAVSPSRYAEHVERYRAARKHAWIARKQGGSEREVVLVRGVDRAGVKVARHEVDGLDVVVLEDAGYPITHWRTDPPGEDGARLAAADRDPRSAWESLPRGPGGQGFTIDLSRSLPVGAVGLVLDPRQLPSRVIVELSEDHIDWQRVADETIEVAHARLAVEPGARGRFVRVLLGDSGDGERWVWETFVFPPAGE